MGLVSVLRIYHREATVFFVSRSPIALQDADPSITHTPWQHRFASSQTLATLSAALKRRELFFIFKGALAGECCKGKIGAPHLAIVSGGKHARKNENFTQGGLKFPISFWDMVFRL